MLHQRGYAKMLLPFLRDEMVGVLSFNQTEPLKTGYIGYRIDEHHQWTRAASRAAGLCTTTLAAAKSGAS